MASQNISNKRGDFLTILIIICILLSLPSLLNIGNARTLEQLIGKNLPWFPAYTVIQLVITFGSLYGLWLLKKWGVYLLIITTLLQIYVIITIIPELSSGLWAAVVITGIWTLVIYPKWKYFK